VSLLVRPVQAIHDNETFGDYDAYQFIPEWNNGPQYLFPIQVSRRYNFVTNYWLEQRIHPESFNKLIDDIEEASRAWKKWRNAEHVVVESIEESQCIIPADTRAIELLFSSGIQIRMGHTGLGRPCSDAVEGEARSNQI
jgi:hypothetical protein